MHMYAILKTRETQKELTHVKLVKTLNLNKI